MNLRKVDKVIDEDEMKNIKRQNLVVLINSRTSL